jgi:hypothetical protein
MGHVGAKPNWQRSSGDFADKLIACSGLVQSIALCALKLREGVFNTYMVLLASQSFTNGHCLLSGFKFLKLVAELGVDMVARACSVLPTLVAQAWLQSQCKLFVLHC